MSLLRRIEKNKDDDNNHDNKSSSRSFRSPTPSRGSVRKRRAIANSRPQTTYIDLATRIRRRLGIMMDEQFTITPDLIKTINFNNAFDKAYTTILVEESLVLSRAERQRLRELVFSDLYGYGPLDALINNPATQRIIVNGVKDIRVDVGDGYTETSLTFYDNEHIQLIYTRMLNHGNQRVDIGDSVVEAYLPDGFHLKAISQEITAHGVTFTLQRASEGTVGASALVSSGSISREAGLFLQDAIRQRANILITGDMGAGRTNLLSFFVSLIPPEDRIIVIEESPEVDFELTNDIRLIHNADEHLQTSNTKILEMAKAHQPDRIILGDINEYNALEFLKIVNLGYSGSLAVVLGTTPQNALKELVNLCLKHTHTQPVDAIKSLIVGGIDYVVHQARLPDGSRRMTHISQINHATTDGFVLKDLFIFQETSINIGKISGELVRVIQ